MGAKCGCEEDRDGDKDTLHSSLPGVTEEDAVEPPAVAAAVVAKEPEQRQPDPPRPRGEDEDAKASPASKEPSRQFDVRVTKTGLDDKLGMDVKHIQGKLEVVHIFPDGAV